MRTAFPRTVGVAVRGFWVGGKPGKLGCVLSLKVRVLVDLARPIGASELPILVRQTCQNRRRQQPEVVEKERDLLAWHGEKDLERYDVR